MGTEQDAFNVIGLLFSANVTFLENLETMKQMINRQKMTKRGKKNRQKSEQECLKISKKHILK